MYQSKRMRALNAFYAQEGGLKAVMLRLYNEGMNYADLAAHFGMTEATIGYYMRRFLESSPESTEDKPDADTCAVT